jgi:hypothetical protein
MSMYSRKTTAPFVLLAFVGMLLFISWPLGGNDTAVPAKGPDAAVSSAESSQGPGMLEKEGRPTPQVKKGKFPWLLAAAGVVVVGVAVYFLFIKKPNYALTVTVGAGAQGTPAAGTYTYKKGTAVAYDFTAQGGYQGLAVTLDGADIAASGSVIMDKDHTLAVSSKEGLHETFTTTAAPGWVSYHGANWSVTGGFYRCVAGATNDWEYIFFNKAWSSASYTVTVRINRVSNNGAFGIFLGTTTSMASGFGYMFDMFNDGTYAIIRENGYGFVPYLGGDATVIKNWGSNPAIHAGANQWNVYKVVKSNSGYTFYINDIAVNAFTDATYDPRYLAIVMKPSSSLTQFDVDYVYLDLGTSTASRPGLPASLVEKPATGDVTASRP